MIRLFLLIFTLFFAGICEGTLPDESKKVKILPQDIRTNSEGIFIYLDEQWIPVQIFKDGNSLSIKPLYQEISYWFIWRCDCGIWNFASDDACRECGRGRYDYTPR